MKKKKIFGLLLASFCSLASAENCSPARAPTIPADSITSAPITAIKLENTGSCVQGGVPVTFGQIFKPGDVLPTDRLAAKLSDGTVIELQEDVKATHADGSARHVILSGLVPSLPNGQMTAELVKTSAPAGQYDATPAALLQSSFAADVVIVTSTGTYTASARDALQTQYTQWLAGQVAEEWIVSAPLKDAAGAEHPLLSARFAVRYYPLANSAKVDVIVENTWAYAPNPQNVTYDVRVNVGGAQVYSKTGLEHYRQARWKKTFWWGNEPKFHVRHDTAYMIASKAVPNYDRSIVVDQAAIASMKTKFVGVSEPMMAGLAAPYMPTTGGRPDIGILPGWAAMYLLSMDKDAKAFTLGTADLAGSWSAHYRDKNTGKPISIVDYPYMTVLGKSTDTYNPVTKKYEAFPACGSVCTNPNTWDSSHQPGLSYLPYVVTGDYYYLEELQFAAGWNLLSSNPGYRQNVKGLFQQDQIRGQAWSMRTLAEAAYITPDADPFKAQYAQFLQNNLDWYDAKYTNNPSPDNTLGVMFHSYAFSYNGNLALAPWQDDFFTAAIGHAVELGFVKAEPLLKWKAKFPVGRMVGSGYCWIDGGIYSLKLRDTTTGPLYTTFAQAYSASVADNVKATTCASQEMAMALHLKVGEMTGYSSSEVGYPSNMQPALAYAANSGISGSRDAWSVFMNRSVKPNYSTGPQFAIVPR